MAFMKPSPAWLTPQPAKHRYAASILATRTPFSKVHCISASAMEAEEALRRCQEAADQAGWQPPTGWQWWRRNDSNQPVVGPCLSE